MMIGMLFNSWINRKKEAESNILLKINEFEQLMGNQQFLYGSLLSIKQYMLSHSQMETAQYLTEFTNLLKTISIYSKRKKISLAEELEITLLYLELEKKRIGEYLQFFKQIDETLETEKVDVKPLFLFKKIEELIENQEEKVNFQIYLVIRRAGKKIECSVVENESMNTFFVNVPSEI